MIRISTFNIQHVSKVDRECGEQYECSEDTDFVSYVCGIEEYLQQTCPLLAAHVTQLEASLYLLQIANPSPITDRFTLQV